MKAGDVDAVQRALQKLENNAKAESSSVVEAALDATDGMGRTLLHVCATNAARSGTAEILQMLLSRRARLDVQDANGESPLALSLAALSVKELTAPAATNASSTISSLLHARAEVVGPF